MQQNRKGKISHALQPISIIPIFFLGILILVLGTHFFTNTMHREVSLELQYVATTTKMLFDTTYPGDYTIKGDTYYSLYKGDVDITTDYTIIDRIQEETGLDVTLFYESTRFLTTLRDQNGERLVGTVASQTIVNDVLYGEEAHFYDNAQIDGNSTYFSYYMPLTNSDGQIVGILFVGKLRNEVDEAVLNALLPLVAAVFATIIVMSVCISIYTKSLVQVLVKIRNYVTAVSSGNMDATLSETVCRRNDEFGQIGLAIQSMHLSLRVMAEQDAITGLFNRRCANRKLAQALENTKTKGSTLCLAIGDIDFFKKINDTYGHDCGDLVLKTVSRTLKEHIRRHGFVARWGGEEFLFVLEYTKLEDAVQILENVRKAVGRLEIPYEGQMVHLTMTFGVTENDGTGIDNLLRIADKMLYTGKENGRNRVIYNPRETRAMEFSTDAIVSESETQSTNADVSKESADVPNTDTSENAADTATTN